MPWFFAAEIGTHIERDHHRDVHLEQLHREEEVAFDVRRVYDVDDRLRLFVEDEIARHDLLAAVRGHGINAGQIGHAGVRVAPHRAVLAVDRDAGEIADVLIRPRELVEQGGLAAVLIPHERKGEQGIVREGIAAPLRMVLARLAESGVLADLSARPAAL